MPELPAVEYTRKMIELNALNAIISSVEFIDNEPDELIFSKEAAEFVKRIGGFCVKEVGRWGKQLWILLWDEKGARAAALLMHLGMTGFVQFEGNDKLKYESSPSRGLPTNLWPPRYTKFIIEFTSPEVKKMAFCDARRLGKIDLLELNAMEDAKLLIIDKFGLGFDPLLSMASLKEFREEFRSLQRRRHKINIKTLLMEQGFVAGLGNWMVDDILMLAGIHPKRKLSTLLDRELFQLHKCIKEVTEIAVSVDAEKSKFPREWLFHIRWQHGKETLTGLEVKNERISGRTTFWVPKLQEKAKNSY